VLLPVTPAVQVALSQWAQGDRALRDLPLVRARRNTVDRVVAEIVAELNRRVGYTFTLDRLAREYDESAAWCRLLVQRFAPDDVWAQDLSVVQDAAFHRFARNATDYR
jgi:hypothetical protein